MSWRCFLACCFTVALPLCGASEMDPETLVHNYTDTLAMQQEYAFKWTKATVRDTRAVTPPFEKHEGRNTYYASGDLITDGRRVAYRMNLWGEFFGHEAIISEHNPYHWSYTFDGTQDWSYNRNPLHKGEPPQGTLVIDPSPPFEGIPDAVSIGFPGHYLLGYIGGAGIRIDEILTDSSTILTVRHEPETIGDVDCPVLDIESKYGRGSLWLDPEHGYNIAQAYFNVRSGDIVNNKPVAPDNEADYSVKDIGFELVDGVWFPVEATVETKGDYQGDRETHKRHIKLTEVTLNPDIDAMDAFSRPDIPDGAVVAYVHSPVRFTWQSGQLIPAVDEYAVKEMEKIALTLLQEELSLQPDNPAQTANAQYDAAPRAAEGPVQEEQHRSLPFLRFALCAAVGVLLLWSIRYVTRARLSGTGRPS